MSSSSETLEVSGQRGLRMAEKPSSFTQTCSMLCQYLKEKGSFGDLSLDIACNMQQSNGTGTPEMFHQKAPPMNFFPFMENSRNLPTTPGDFKSMDLFPQQAGFGSSVPREDVPKMADSSVKKSAPGEPQKAQMTIFYGGQVIVFDDFPADKAKEVMLLASKESSHGQAAQASVPAKSNIVFASHLGKNPLNSSSSVPPSANMFPKFGNQVIQEAPKPSPQPIVCDLPIARKASLHRFLEKRKDRINNKAPYQTSSPATGPAKPAEEENLMVASLASIYSTFKISQYQSMETKGIVYWLWRALSIFLDQAKFVNQWFHMVTLFTSIPCSAVSFLQVHEWRDISQVLPNLINWASHAMLKVVGRWGRLSFDPFFSFKNKNYGD